MLGNYAKNKRWNITYRRRGRPCGRAYLTSLDFLLFRIETDMEWNYKSIIIKKREGRKWIPLFEGQSQQEAIAFCRTLTE